MTIYVPPEIVDALKIVGTIAGAVLADLLVSRYLRSIARVLHVSVETLKGLRFFFRFIILAVALMVLASVSWFPTEYFFGAGALIGTIMGLASASIVSNFLAGAYVLVSRVVRIGDYIRVGDEEGVVIDMSVNYTKILKSDGTVAYISNRDISTKRIVNFRVEENGREYYVYPVGFSLDASVPTSRVKEFVRNLEEELKGMVLSLSLRVESVGRLEVKYSVVVRVDDAEKILTVKPKILMMVADLASSR